MPETIKVKGKMFFHTLNHIYMTYFNNEIICLDLKSDQYHCLPEALSDDLSVALANEFKKEGDQYIPLSSSVIVSADFSESIKTLRDADILSEEDYLQPSATKVIKGEKSTGAANVDWRMHYGDLQNKVSKKLTLEAYITLIKVYFLLKIRGFHFLIRSIKKKTPPHYLEKNAAEFNSLVVALNKACFYFPVRTKCLEWSAALTFMGLRRKWKCNMKIGVQNLPFEAHAWVEAKDKVIADTPDLPNTLSVILSEPF